MNTFLGVLGILFIAAIAVVVSVLAIRSKSKEAPTWWKVGAVTCLWLATIAAIWAIIAHDPGFGNYIPGPNPTIGGTHVAP